MPSPLINSLGWFLQRNSFNYFKGWKRGQWLIRWDDPHISSNEQYFVLESSRSDNFLLEIQNLSTKKQTHTKKKKTHKENKKTPVLGVPFTVVLVL